MNGSRGWSRRGALAVGLLASAALFGVAAGVSLPGASPRGVAAQGMAQLPQPAPPADDSPELVLPSLDGSATRTRPEPQRASSPNGEWVTVVGEDGQELTAYVESDSPVTWRIEGRVRPSAPSPLALDGEVVARGRQRSERVFGRATVATDGRFEMELTSGASQRVALTLESEAWALEEPRVLRASKVSRVQLSARPAASITLRLQAPLVHPVAGALPETVDVRYGYPGAWRRGTAVLSGTLYEARFTGLARRRPLSLRVRSDLWPDLVIEDLTLRQGVHLQLERTLAAGGGSSAACRTSSAARSPGPS